MMRWLWCGSHWEQRLALRWPRCWPVTSVPAWLAWSPPWPPSCGCLKAPWMGASLLCQAGGCGCRPHQNPQAQHSHGLYHILATSLVMRFGDALGPSIRPGLPWLAWWPCTCRLHPAGQCRQVRILAPQPQPQRPAGAVPAGPSRPVLQLPTVAVPPAPCLLHP